MNAPASRSLAGTGAGDVASWGVLGAIVPCAWFGPFEGCAMGHAGALRVSSDGAPDRSARWTTAWAAGARVGVLVHLDGAAFLRVHTDMLANITPVRLEIGGTNVWTAPRVESNVGMDVILRFP